MTHRDGGVTRRANLVPAPMRETTVAGSLIVDVLAFLERAGVPRADACRAAGLDAAALGDGADVRVPGSQAERLWTFAIARTGDPLLGLHLSQHFSPGALDIVGYVILSCRTVGDALDRLARYAAVLNDGLRVTVTREGATAWCRMTYHEGRDNFLLRPGGAPVVDAMWGGLARELRTMATAPVAVREAWFRRDAPPAQQAEYRRVLGTSRVRFGADDDRVAIAAADLGVPMRSANAVLLRAFERHADAAAAALEEAGTVGGEVARELAARMKGAAPAIGDVARALATSARNLQRALRQEGTTFQALLDGVRRELALRHLADPATPVAQVAFLLGFSEPSAFHRAFRRWTGEAPAAWRRRAANAGPGA